MTIYILPAIFTVLTKEISGRKCLQGVRTHKDPEFDDCGLLNNEKEVKCPNRSCYVTYMWFNDVKKKPLTITSCGDLDGKPIDAWNIEHGTEAKEKVERIPDGQCNADLNDDDLQLRIQVLEEVGCIPIYWKNTMYTQLNLEICDTREDMETIWNMLDNFTAIHSTYDPPCNEMELTVTYNARPTDGKLLFLKFKYLDKNYQEIVNERDFGLESLWSTVGGFVGIFVGVSLSQVPDLVDMTFTWLQKLIKSYK